ncbi:MAG TPA: hypothetical protein VFH20_07730 [Propionibacteriaceae bacterium]|nr:hypothetical protein [Propionibacteriaceae bacterium]
MTGRELDDSVRELYVLPPTHFVAARNDLVRKARAAGSREIAERLQQLRRPTRSAWLVNLLASDSAAMQRLSALGRQLRDAQTGLAAAELRSLAEQRRRLIADLMERAQAYADDAGVRLTPTVLSEVQATLQAALVDLAGAMMIRNGRLVRPLSHSGFGPRPRVGAPQIKSGQIESGQIESGQIESGAELRPVEVPASPVAEIESPRVEDELAARRRVVAGRRALELVEVTDGALAEDQNDPAPVPEVAREVRQAEEELAAAEAAHWTSEFELADAEAAVEAAEDALSELDSRRIEARRDKVTAQRHLAEARSRQRDAVNALAQARRRVEAARQSVGEDD